MKICFIGPSTSAHIKKWCKWFIDNGHEVDVISFSSGTIEGVNVHYVNAGADIYSTELQKLKYLSKIRMIKSIIRDIRPDIINVHYVSSYGSVAALLGIKNYVLSMWGTDIFAFPRRSFFHKKLVQFSLKKAPYLFSTSEAMAKEAHKYVNKEILITPFGVDLNLFSPAKRVDHEGRFVVGTVKAIEKKYGIDYLLQAVSHIKQVRPDIPIELRIAGKGRDEKELKKLGVDLGIDDCIKWLGFISQDKAAVEWANFDIGVVYSTVQESFGVSAIEAQASGTPLIISDSDGLIETTAVGKSSISLPKGNSRLLADTIINLYDSPSERKKMGKEGRLYVQQHYEINDCFKRIESYFENIAYAKK